MPVRLTRITIRGFKSISEIDLELRQVNVMIGANAAGKSNLVSFFSLLNHMLAAPSGDLQRFVAEQGGAASLLHDGAKRTPQIEGGLIIETNQGTNDYRFRLFHAAGDRLIFAEEACRYSQRKRGQNPNWLELGGGHSEAEILQRSKDDLVDRV